MNPNFVKGVRADLFLTRLRGKPRYEANLDDWHEPPMPMTHGGEEVKEVAMLCGHVVCKRSDLLFAEDRRKWKRP